MAAFTDLCDVHDFDGRQLSRFDMSTLERESEERERLKPCHRVHQNGGRGRCSR